MRSELRYFTFGGDMFGQEKRKACHFKELALIKRRPNIQFSSRIEEIRKRREQREVSYSFQLQQKEKNIKEENCFILKKISLANTSIPRQTPIISKTFNVRSNSLKDRSNSLKENPKNVKPSISTRKLQQ